MRERFGNRKGCKKLASRSISRYVVLPGVILDGLGAVAKNPQTHFSVLPSEFVTQIIRVSATVWQISGEAHESRANVRTRMGHYALTTALKFLIAI
jgi:hypothetical protein